MTTVGVCSRRVGVDSLLLECAGGAEVQAVYAEALRRRDRGELRCRDIVPAASTVLLTEVVDPDTVQESVAGWPTDVPDHDGGELVELPVTYDGPDLDRVAGHWGVTTGEVARRHQEIDYVVAFCGFAPGFAYLSGLPEELAVPRLERPRSKVPPGSVGLAGSYTGVYPRSSPGGWLLVARTERTLWDLRRSTPALLRPGTRVRFVDG